MSAVSTIKPNLSAIQVPSPLRKLPGWLVWRYEPNAGGGKPRKVPYFTNGMRRHGVQGSVQDRQCMTTFEAARSYAARKGFDGVGLALMPEFNIVALDFDDCIFNGQLHPEVEAIASASYAEYSPSGNGVRCFFIGDLGNKKDSPGIPYGMETFSTKGFVTVTGNQLDITELVGNTDTIAPLTDDVHALYAKRFGERIIKALTLTNHDPLGLTQDQIAACVEALPTDLSYDDWVQTGMALHHEFNGDTDGFTIWDEWSQGSSKYTTRDYSWERWVSFGKHTGAPVTARSLVRLANENGARIQLNGPASMEEFDQLPEVPQAADEFDVIPTQPVAEKQHARFEPIHASEFASSEPSKWIIKSVLPEAELVVMYGASGSGKSFAILDMVACVARGTPWRGHKVKQGRVVYICAEGAGGFKKRLTAYAIHHKISLADIDLFVIPNSPNLLLKADALEINKAIGKAAIVVIDTLAQTTPGGDENGGKDMGLALAHCKGIHRGTGATVVLIHHSGKDATKGARGWSGLRAAADAEFEVLRLPNGRVLKTSKQKDGDDSAAWGFDLNVIEVGRDEDDEAITSCVIHEMEVTLAGATSLTAMGPTEMIVDKVIREMAEVQTTGIEVKAVLAEAVKRMEGPVDGKRDTRRQRADRSLKKMCEGDTAPYWLEDGCISIV